MQKINDAMLTKSIPLLMQTIMNVRSAAHHGED